MTIKTKNVQLSDLAGSQMLIEWDVPIEMGDGVVLRADIFRPVGDGPFPVILSYGPYGKGLAFQDGYPSAWKILEEKFPDAVAGSSNNYQSWEVVDPEKWIPKGYSCIRVDSRGAGRSEGLVDLHAPRETQDLYECIEWAGSLAWSNGKVGLAGVSYFATNQWRVAAMQPPSLAAICVWEVYADRYRDSSYHGGIRCTFTRSWQDMQVKTVQNGRGERGPRSPFNGLLICGDDTLSDDELADRRVDIWSTISSTPLDGPYYQERSPDFSRIQVPLLSCGNWGGHGLHLRGNIEGYVRAASSRKWLEVHDGEHWAEFYTDYGVQLQQAFFGRFLKGEENGWDARANVQVRVRHLDGTTSIRSDSHWPLSTTEWTLLYLDLENGSLVDHDPAQKAECSFDALGEGLDFLSAPLSSPIELTGPLAVSLSVSSSTEDADLFVVIRVYDPDGEEVTFQGALDPRMPLAFGWLRASHRHIDKTLSTPYRPYHSHDRKQLLTPGIPVKVQIEIWPTSMVIPAGYRLGLTVRGRDYEHSGVAASLSNMKNPMRGCGPFVHDDETDRPRSVFGGKTTLHADNGSVPQLLLPLQRSLLADR
ncbi:CocE/NonD family hydrolase [Pseudomonas helleri]|uniref:CocE/NonD family hydrolase n=1 Tax=Pseudomonas helleri TaxID=1608996 RepID=UPI003FD3A0AF